MQALIPPSSSTYLKHGGLSMFELCHIIWSNLNKSGEEPNKATQGSNADLKTYKTPSLKCY